LFVFVGEQQNFSDVNSRHEVRPVENARRATQKLREEFFIQRPRFINLSVLNQIGLDDRQGHRPVDSPVGIRRSSATKLHCCRSDVLQRTVFCERGEYNAGISVQGETPVIPALCPLIIPEIHVDLGDARVIQWIVRIDLQCGPQPFHSLN
jgi:hypothetical protein